MPSMALPLPYTMSQRQMSAKCDSFGVGLVLWFFFGRVVVSPHDRMGSLPWSVIWIVCWMCSMTLGITLEIFLKPLHFWRYLVVTCFSFGSVELVLSFRGIVGCSFGQSCW